MLIRDILRGKGSSVATIHPDATVAQLLATLVAHNVGALVASEDGVTIAGIVSERDVVRHLHEHRASVLDMPVSSIMTPEVLTCALGDRADDLRPTMIEHRIRHLPVVDEGTLAGIVSIGDVVKSAISVLETDREHLIDYIHG